MKNLLLILGLTLSTQAFSNPDTLPETISFRCKAISLSEARETSNGESFFNPNGGYSSYELVPASMYVEIGGLEAGEFRDSGFKVGKSKVVVFTQGYNNQLNPRFANGLYYPDRKSLILGVGLFQYSLDLRDQSELDQEGRYELSYVQDIINNKMYISKCKQYESL